MDGDVEASSSSTSSTVPADAKVRKPTPARKVESTPIRKTESTPAAPTIEPSVPLMKTKSTPTSRPRNARKKVHVKDIDKELTAAITQVRRDELEEEKEKEENKEMEREEIDGEQLMEQADALAQEEKQEEQDKALEKGEEAHSSEERVQEELVEPPAPTEIPKREPFPEESKYEEIAQRKRRILAIDDVKTSDSTNKDSPHE